MTTQSGKVLWTIKRDDLLRGTFGKTKLRLGEVECCLIADRYSLGGNKMRLMIIHNYGPFDYSTTLGRYYIYGRLTLFGSSGKHTDTKPWDRPDVHVTFAWEHPVLSFDDIYLFPDGTYHFEFLMNLTGSLVHFTDPQHELLLGPDDAGCLKIEDRIIYVSKSYLATVSPYFKTLFFSNFQEKNQEVVSLRDVQLSPFRQFLAHLYKRFSTDIDVDKIPEVLQLADMFLCSDAIQSCEHILVNNKPYAYTHLELADKYHLPYLRSLVIETLPVADLKTYLIQTAADEAHEATRLRIVERIETETEASPAIVLD